MFLKGELDLRRIEPEDYGISSLLVQSKELMTSLYPAESNHSLGFEEFNDPGCFLIGAYVNGEPIGCGAVRICGGRSYGEIKAVYVVAKHRRKGVSRAIMNELEAHLVSQKIYTARLEAGNKQPEALGLYSWLGYVERGPFGNYSLDPNSIFMEKRVGT